MKKLSIDSTLNPTPSTASPRRDYATFHPTPHPASHLTSRGGRLIVHCIFLLSISIVFPNLSAAQDWGNDSDDNGWSQPARPTTSSRQQDSLGPTTGWSVRAGIGFIDDPTALLLNFEAPYAFDQWVSVGPMLQIGIDDNNTVVAPSLNVTVTIPNLPGDDFDRIKPYGLIGMGFAYIEDDNRQNDNSSFGFLIDVGIGIEYQVSDHLFLGTQMMFNFLPEETLEEHFFFSWQVGGVRLAF